MANRFNRSIREIRDIEKQPLHTNEQNDLLSDINDDVYVRLRRRYERITGLPALEKKFNNHLMDYNQFKDDTQSMLIYLNDVNERQDMMIDKLNTDVSTLITKAQRLKEISDQHTEQLKSLTQQLSDVTQNIHQNIEVVNNNIAEIGKTLDTIRDNDKQDKLQSEIDEVRKTVEAIKTDLEETQAIEDIKQLNQSLQNFFSVSSNVTENVTGKKDMLYFDIYSIIDNTDLNSKNIKVTQKHMDKIGNLEEEEELPINEEIEVKKLSSHYLSLFVNVSNYQEMYLFTLYINNVPYHERLVRFSDYQ